MLSVFGYMYVLQYNNVLQTYMLTYAYYRSYSHTYLQIPFTGPTAIHVAARCGALDTVACLLANYANILATDQDGWAPIHHAAFFDHYPVLRLMIRKNRGLMELVTKNE